jgi:hypothetical protein
MGGKSQRGASRISRANSAITHYIGKLETAPATAQRNHCSPQHVKPEPFTSPRNADHRNMPNSKNAQTINKGAIDKHEPNSKATSTP